MSSIMPEYKGVSAILTGPYGQPYNFDQLTSKLPSKDEALVKFDFSGVCHGDVYMRDGGARRLRHHIALYLIYSKSMVMSKISQMVSGLSKCGESNCIILSMTIARPRRESVFLAEATAPPDFPA